LFLPHFLFFFILLLKIYPFLPSSPSATHPLRSLSSFLLTAFSADLERLFVVFRFAGVIFFCCQGSFSYTTIRKKERKGKKGEETK